MPTLSIAQRRLLTPILILLVAITATFTVIGYDAHQRGSRPPARSAESYWQRPAPQPDFLRDVPRVYYPDRTWSPLAQFETWSPLAQFDSSEIKELLGLPNYNGHSLGDHINVYLNGRQVSSLQVWFNFDYSLTFLDPHRLPYHAGLNVARIEFVDVYNQTRFYEWAFCVPGGEIDCEA